MYSSCFTVYRYSTNVLYLHLCPPINDNRIIRQPSHSWCSIYVSLIWIVFIIYHQTLEKYQPSHFCAPPTAFRQMVKQRLEDFPHLGNMKKILAAGEPLVWCYFPICASNDKSLEFHGLNMLGLWSDIAGYYCSLLERVMSLYNYDLKCKTMTANFWHHSVIL